MIKINELAIFVFDNLVFFSSLLFQAKMANISWLQLLKYSDLLLFFVMFDVNEVSLRFGLLV